MTKRIFAPLCIGCVAFVSFGGCAKPTPFFEEFTASRVACRFLQEDLKNPPELEKCRFRSKKTANGYDVVVWIELDGPGFDAFQVSMDKEGNVTDAITYELIGEYKGDW
jgi:hypothetical protein